MHAAIIGVEGGMGRWLKKHVAGLGYTVSGFDERRGESPSKLGEADLVIVSVPIQDTVETIRKTIKHMKPGACIIEIASLKTGIHEALREAASQGFDALCVHPMFGPSTDSLEGKTVAVIPVIDAEYEITETSKLFPGATLEVIEVEEHDRLMSIILSLPYLINLAFAATVQDEDLLKLRRLSGSTFSLQYLLAQSVSMEKTELIEGLLSLNPRLKETGEKFFNNISKITQAADNKELQGLHEEIKDSMMTDSTWKKAQEHRQKMFDTIKKGY